MSTPDRFTDDFDFVENMSQLPLMNTDEMSGTIAEYGLGVFPLFSSTELEKVFTR